MPGQPTGRLGRAPLSYPRATRFCHWPGAGGGVAVRFCGRSDRVRRAPAHWGPAGRWHFFVRRDGHCDPPTPFQDPPVSPLPSASRLLTKERPLLLPLPRPPRTGESVRRPEGLFCAQTFGPRSSHPTSFASPVDVCEMSSSLAPVPSLEEASCSWAGPETSIVSSVYYLHLGSRGLSGHSGHCIWERGPWAWRLDWDPLPGGCLTWRKGLDPVEHAHIVLANCTLAAL